MARPNKYNDVILPRINEVKQWISEGLTDREIVANLGISESTWFKYKQKVSEFSETIKECRKPKVKELENTMFRLANGYSVSVKKVMKVRKSDGSEALEEYEETVHVPPNFNACRFLLTNWNNDYSNDPALIRIRREEFEHKKIMDEQNSW